MLALAIRRSMADHLDPTAPLIAAGQRVFGENRVQEAAAKWPALRAVHPDIELHLIGQLQSNKADEAVALFDCIHSLDRPSLVSALAKAMDKPHIVGDAIGHYSRLCPGKRAVAFAAIVQQ